MSSEVTLDDMWKKIEEYGINRQIFEATNPSSELLYQMYTAITKLNEMMTSQVKTKDPTD